MMELKTSKQIFHSVNDGIEINDKWVSTEDMLEWLEIHFMSPFCGSLQSENKEAVEVYRKIVEHNLEKFNELTRIFDRK